MNNSKKLKMNAGFRIRELKLFNHHILGTNSFRFYDERDEDKGSPYFSVIIGPNGTGKSEILRCLLQILRDFYQNYLDSDKRIKPLGYSFDLKYQLNSKIYSYRNFFDEKNDGNYKRFATHGRLYSVENSEITFSNNNYYNHFPRQVVAQSIMLTDKYFVLRNETEKLNFAPYHYLGIRNRPQQSSTGFYVRRTVELIIKAVGEEFFSNGVSKMIEFMGGKGSFSIEYKTSNTKLFFSGKLKSSELNDYFAEIESKYKGKQAPYKLSDFKRTSEKQFTLDKKVQFINNLVDTGKLKPIKGSSSQSLSFDLSVDSDMMFLKDNQYKIDDLRKIGLLHAPTIKFSNSNVELQKSSSGEFHFFTTMIGLMASIRKNSIVIIDEPEISLHPNWQMRYIDFIRKLFEGTDRESAHIIIATHSHFIVSDLPGRNGNIIGLKKIENEIKTIEINKNTFGWSAEEVLYKVFDVRTTRNHYLEMDIRKMLALIAEKSENRDEIRDILSRLINVQLNEHDPLGLVINQAKKYIA